MNNGRSVNIPAVVAYLSWIGWIIAIVMRDPTDPFAAHHMNQALVLNIVSLLAGVLNILPLIGNLASMIVSVAMLVLWVMGIYRAATWDDRPLPIIGDIHLMG